MEPASSNAGLIPVEDHLGGEEGHDDRGDDCSEDDPPCVTQILCFFTGQGHLVTPDEQDQHEDDGEADARDPDTEDGNASSGRYGVISV